MNAIDRKVAKAILKLTNEYDELLWYSVGTEIYKAKQIRESGECIRVKLPEQEIGPSIDRLIKDGYLKLSVKPMDEIYLFYIQPPLLHPFVFWIDRFSKQYVGGFISGVAITITANLLAPHVQSVLSAILQWLRSLK